MGFKHLKHTGRGFNWAPKTHHNLRVEKRNYMVLMSILLGLKYAARNNTGASEETAPNLKFQNIMWAVSAELKIHSMLVSSGIPIVNSNDASRRLTTSTSVLCLTSRSWHLQQFQTIETPPNIWECMKRVSPRKTNDFIGTMIHEYIYIYNYNQNLGYMIVG